MNAFSELYQYTPKPISFSRVVYTSKSSSDTLQITGKAQKYDDIWQFVESMNKATLLNSFENLNYGQNSRAGNSFIELSAHAKLKRKRNE